MKNFISQVFAGKSLGRILFNRALRESTRSLSGRVIDLAGGGHSYRKYLPKGVTLVVTDYVMRPGVDVVVDLNKPLPFPDASEQALLCMNALYILEDRVAFFTEAKRVLKQGGKFIFSSPFITNEMREPHDYVRLTSEGLMKELIMTEWSDISITPYGERGSAAMYLLHPVFLFNIIRLPFFTLGLLIDRLLPTTLVKAHPSPIGYMVSAIKK